MKKILLLALMALGSYAFAQTAVVTECEWYVGADPGVGNGNDIAIGTPEANEALGFTIATGRLTRAISSARRCVAASTACVQARPASGVLLLMLLCS
ncbi:MAG: hypothetical protein IPG71_02765 [bacterium]|nr:hypothetical protein [bacterium]